VAILGFGTEGQAALKFLVGLGVTDLTICDEKEKLDAPELGAEVSGKVTFRLGKGAFETLTDFRTVIRSPGVRYDLPSLKEAREAGVNVTSMTKLTLEYASERVTAITGTNGKTTTTALTAAILGAHYGDALIVGGNDRRPILEEALKDTHRPILIEASSFQFADLHHSPYIAAVLNITPNHLDWHKDMEDYIAAKENLLKYQKPSDWAVLNAKNENTAKLAASARGQVFWIGEKRGDEWAVWEDGYLKLSFGGQTENLLHWDQINVKTHPDNLLFAVAIAKLHYVPATTIEEQMKQFVGVEHRLEHVRTLNDVHFYNDSSSTSPESAEMAIDQFVQGKLILLLGGSSKKADFSFLAVKMLKLGVRCVLYGAEGQRIKEALLTAQGGIGQGGAVHTADALILEHVQDGDFEKVIRTAFEHARPEDSIVLSPACASFDMFKNSKERGNRFKEIVSESF
jgi:UDP-N-acetylmuramoylalanine--D-glutamate ligase